MVPPQNQRIPKHSSPRALRGVLAPFVVNKPPCKAQLKSSLGQFRVLLLQAPPISSHRFDSLLPPGWMSPQGWTPTLSAGQFWMFWMPGESQEMGFRKWPGSQLVLKSTSFLCYLKHSTGLAQGEFPMLEHYIPRFIY